MNKRFYFDLVNHDETIRDEVGVEAKTIEEAEREARSVIGEVLGEDSLWSCDGPWHLVIRNERGDEVRRLPLM